MVGLLTTGYFLSCITSWAWIIPILDEPDGGENLIYPFCKSENIVLFEWSTVNMYSFSPQKSFKSLDNVRISDYVSL